VRFGAIPVDDALGAVLAHSVKTMTGRLRKGVVLTDADLEQLRATGLREIVVAKLDAGDVEENDAAARLAKAIVPDPAPANLNVSQAFTGRVNLIASVPGIVLINEDGINALNAIDPMITCATVLPMARMEAGGLVATIKIISYAVTDVDLAAACVAADRAMSLAPVVLKTAELIVTDTGAGPDDKKGIAAVRQRLDNLGMTLTQVTPVPHQVDAIAAAIAASDAELVLILTASATSDLNDTAPSALRQAGGTVTRFGMPVDPGNLLFLGNINKKPVIGLPGCARSPALNGADWVLERIACGVDVTCNDISAMGVGGLLKEIPQRPQPRRQN
jgi:molybdenum cofactor cytidylyltransferase